MLAITVQECDAESLVVCPSPEIFPEHAHIDFNGPGLTKSDIRGKAKRLIAAALTSADGNIGQPRTSRSISEKIDDADMQRSWSKVKSLTEKRKPPKKKVAPVLADMAADAKPDKLDTLEEEAQLLARTILERQKKAVPASAMPDIISLAERFAKADEGMWGAARAMAFREELDRIGVRPGNPGDTERCAAGGHAVPRAYPGERW